VIYFKSPYFPPSSNNAYFTKLQRKGGKSIPIRVLTNEGRKYKREFKTWLAKEHPNLLAFFGNKHGEFSILVVLYFKEVYNAGWPKTVKTRHKRLDASNRVKVLEDALAEACGHDDSQHMTISSMKSRADSGQEPYFELWAWNSEEEDGPIEQFVSAQQLHD
jgi:Holliday junction resolvase RusA-like endonuclease